MTTQLSLKQLYDKVLSKPAPGLSFVKEVANVTKKSEPAVRRWLSGAATPDALTQEVLAKHFKTTPEALFPKS